MEHKSFEIIAGDAKSHVIIHVPHGGLAIPDWVRSEIVLDDQELDAEKLLMADIATDALASRVHETSETKPHLFVNRLSRLVIDPERFPDETEEMNAVGMGVVYTKTSDQHVLRNPSPEHEKQLIDEFFIPYSEALAALTSNLLEEHGRVVIIDLHSFGAQALPYELHANDARPNVCVGVDEYHTPHSLQEACFKTFSDLGTIEVNQPFKGTYIPLKFYGTEPRVTSVMIELRKDTYGFGEPNTQLFKATVRAIAGLVAHCGC
jgi:N-formylglutamate amidohydrolase